MAGGWGDKRTNRRLSLLPPSGIKCAASPAHQVQVLLLQVEEPAANGDLQITWTGAIPLGWRHQQLYPPARTIGAPADADLCSVVKNKWLELHPLVVPFNLEVRRRESCTFVLSLQAQGSEGDSPVIRIKITWDGKWHDGAQEMRRHLILEVLGEPRPNPAIERSAQQLRCWVPGVLRAPAPAHCERCADARGRRYGPIGRPRLAR